MIFVYEYTCAAPAWAALPQSLHAEGAAMLRAVLEDFHRAKIATTTLLSQHCTLEFPGDSFRYDSKEESSFRALSQCATWTLAIAPESDNLLYERARWIEEAGGRSLGCTPSAIELAGDKLRLADHLRQAGIATPKTTEFGDNNPLNFPCVVKPRFGAGSQQTYLLQSPTEKVVVERQLKQEHQPFIGQPYIGGVPVSVSFLIGSTEKIALPPTRQILSDDGRFRYLGGECPIDERLAIRARTTAGRAVNAIPGLSGWIGVDLVLGEIQDLVIEVNPRLTSSYTVLRDVCSDNLAERILSIAQQPVN